MGEADLLGLVTMNRLDKPTVLKGVPLMITCVVDYTIDPAKLAEFERFARRWIELVNAHGGTHHGYFLPSEGASDKALALFSFPGLAAYERYRQLFAGTRTSLRPTGSATRAGAWSVTNGRS